MIDTERDLLQVRRLHDEILRERAEGLRESAGTYRARLLEREEALARLRVQVAALKASLAPKPAPAPIPVPAKEAPSDSARFKEASLPRTGSFWTRAAPYAAIAAFAAVMELGGARRPAPASARDLAAFARPAPAAVVLGEKAVAKGAPVVADEDRSQEALLLVHEWTLPGDERTLGDRLGGGLDLPGGRPAWSVERTAENGYRVTFRDGARDASYSFDADLAARVVWPTPETQELIAPASPPRCATPSASRSYLNSARLDV
ncbi:MAG: hypothetical protein M0D55_16760 [Elusimicrobiota bacterium]|nr:MAG: hypothetical protein M0D55_16760 [Elusimicrobiota bacterium]